MGRLNCLHSNLMRFDEKLSDLLKSRNLKATDIARKHGASANTVRRWATPKGDPSLSEVRWLAGFFDVPIAFLADDELDEPARAPVLSDAEQIALNLVRQIGVAEALDVLYAMRARRPQASGPAIEAPVPGATNVKRREQA